MALVNLKDKCCPKKKYIPDLYKPGYMTEYTDNYIWSSYIKYRDLDKNLLECDEWAEKMEKEKCPTVMYDGKTSVVERRHDCDDNRKVMNFKEESDISAEVESISVNKEFISCQNESINRSTKVKRRPDGGYVDPFRNIITNQYGRRLNYDITHPDILHSSLPSSELADISNIYSFKAPIRQMPEIPWTRELTWKAEGQTGNWPTKLWKSWVNTASSPAYDGYDDQCQYSKYKTPLVDTMAMMNMVRSPEKDGYDCKY